MERSVLFKLQEIFFFLFKWIYVFSQIVSCPIISDLSDARSSITRQTNGLHVDGMMNFTVAYFLIPSTDWFLRLNW